MLREQTTAFAPPDRVRGALFGLAIGDALGQPADGLSHQNVRMYLKGVKGYRDDEHRGGAAGTGTHLTEQAVALAHALGTRHAYPDYPSAFAHVVLGGVRGLAGETPAEPLAAAQAWCVAHLAQQDADGFDGEAFWQQLCGAVPAQLAGALVALTSDLDAFPLDLADACGGTDDAPSAWRFAVAMFTRNPHLVEATLLSAINVGGRAAAVGALVGSLLGALHGADAFPDAWRDDLAAFAEVEAAATALRQGTA